MLKWLLGVVGAVVVFSVGCATAPAPSIEPDIVEAVSHTVRIDAILVLKAPDGRRASAPMAMGTGTVLGQLVPGEKNPRPVILTARHVCLPTVPESFKVPPAFTCEVILRVTGRSGKTEFPARVIRAADDADLCLVEGNVDTSPAHLGLTSPPLGARLQNSASIDMLFGSKQGVVDEGRYAGYEVDEKGTVYAFTTHRFHHGDSGGGLFYNNKLVGVVIGGVYNEGTERHLGVFVPLGVVLRFLEGESFL